MGEKIKTIIEELVKQDTLTLNILFPVWAKATQFLPREIDLGLAKECCHRSWACDFFLNLSGIMQYCSVVEYEIFLDIMCW